MKESDSSDVDPRPLLSEDGMSTQSEQDLCPRQPRHVVQNKNSRMLSILLFISLVLNVGMITAGLFPRQLRTSYAQLDTPLVVPIDETTEYATTNLTEGWALWGAVNFDPGMIALPTAWAKQKSLPPSITFPWDQDKDLYLVHGYHQLHCLKNIYRSLKEFKEGLDQSLPLGHITHCFDSIRADIICQADDTPRYAAFESSSGVGQLRQCRDWKKLEEWVSERTACYSYLGPKAQSINQYRRFQFCPKDSPYWPAVRAHFGKPDDWFGEDDDELKELRSY